MILQRDRGAEDRHHPVAGGLHGPAAVAVHRRRRALYQLGHDLAQPLDLHAAAMSIERTTSANNTVTCLYSAVSPEAAVGAPHSSQNLAFSLKPVPQDPHATPAAIRAPPIQGHYYSIVEQSQLPTIGRSTAENCVIHQRLKPCQSTARLAAQ